MAETTAAQEILQKVNKLGEHHKILERKIDDLALLVAEALKSASARKEKEEDGGSIFG